MDSGAATLWAVGLKASKNEAGGENVIPFRVRSARDNQGRIERGQMRRVF